MKIKHEQKFCRRNNTTKQEHEILDLCEKFGNSAEGISSLSLGKLLWSNHITSIEQLKNCSIEDISKFDGVGPKRVEMFIKIKTYLENM